MKISSFSTGNVKTNSERNIPFIFLDFLLKPISVAHCSIYNENDDDDGWNRGGDGGGGERTIEKMNEWCESTEFNINERVEKDMAI